MCSLSYLIAWRPGCTHSFFVLHPVNRYLTLDHSNPLNFWRCSGVTMLIEEGEEKSPFLSLFPSTVVLDSQNLIYPLA